MKKFLFFILFLLIIGAAGYGAYTTVKYVPNEQLLIVFDTKEDRILYSCRSGWHVIPYTLIPGRVTLYPVDTTGSFSIEVSIPLPALALLKDPAYTIDYGISVDYELETESFHPTRSFLSEPEKIIQTAVSMYADSAFTELLSPYVTGEYSDELIKNSWSSIKDSFFSRVQGGATIAGVTITRISEEKVPKIPDNQMYQYGMLLRNDLLELRKKHTVELETVQHSLDLKDIETDRYYQKLQKISDLISANPDLLKYMYIEKLGSQVQVILPQSMTGYPFGLDRTNKEKKIVQETESQSEDDKDIDNLE